MIQVPRHKGTVGNEIKIYDRNTNGTHIQIRIR